MNKVLNFFKKSDIKTTLIDNAMYVILLTILVVVSILRPVFLSPNNLTKTSFDMFNEIYSTIIIAIVSDKK